MANKGKNGRFISSKGGQAAEEGRPKDPGAYPGCYKEDVHQLSEDSFEEVFEILSAAEEQVDTVRPIVTRIPPNFRLVLCDVGPHKLVRVMVRPNNSFYIPRMVIPMDVNLANFDPTKLLIYNGNPPIRKGQW